MRFYVLFFSLCLNACRTAAPAQAVSPATGHGDSCASFAHQWPETIRQIEAILRLRNATVFKQSLADMQAYLAALDTKTCPQWAEAVAMEQALCHEFSYIYGMTHDADQGEDALQVPGHSLESLRAEYIAINDRACLVASYKSSQALRVWGKQPKDGVEAERQQRYAINLETDAALINDEGAHLGASGEDGHFVALVQTRVLDAVESSLLALQGQGPLSPDAAAMYVRAGVAFATRERADRLVFVNAAGGQVPNFSSQVGAHPMGADKTAVYVEYAGWNDGTLVTPDQAARFVNDVVAPQIADQHRTVLVFNCNAGLDRSGTLNALTQLAVQAQRAAARGVSQQEILDQGFLAIPSIVARLKEARPHSISTFGRYMFVYQSYEAYVRLFVPPGH